jgi:hypothetical protein
MARPKLNGETKKCREDLRVLALWRLDKGPVQRAELRTWLAGSVDIEWGSQGRPRDLRSAEVEADAAIEHLLQQGNCKVTGKPGQEKVRLVRPVHSLEKRLGRLRDIEEKARQEAGKGLQEGGPAGGTEMLPGSWEKQAVGEVGERVAHAVGQAVVEQLKHESVPEARTPEHEPGAATEEPREALSAGAATGAAPVGEGQRGKGFRRARFVMIPVDRLLPNDWNPNLMTPEQEGRVQEEVRRGKGPAHDILVRPLTEVTYEILDGEHNWAAAKEDGIAEVPCEVVEVNDLEAMRLTYVRNQHGTRDRLLTGRLFQRMLGLAGVAADSAGNSQREFARQNNISEGSLRNYLLYARAAEVRKHYAPETADDTVRGLTVAEVRLYLGLPEDQRDEWLDRGADGDEAHQILAQAGKKPKGRTERESKQSRTARRGRTGESADGASGEQGRRAIKMKDPQLPDGVASGELSPNASGGSQEIAAALDGSVSILAGIQKAFYDLIPTLGNQEKDSLDGKLNHIRVLVEDMARLLNV